MPWSTMEKRSFCYGKHVSEMIIHVVNIFNDIIVPLSILNREKGMFKTLFMTAAIGIVIYYIFVRMCSQFSQCDII